MKTAKPKCLITGCDIYVPEEGRTLHGDLWIVGDTWVFHGVKNSDGQAAWTYKYNEEAPGRKLIVRGEYFERNGVLVVSSYLAQLNDNAQRYVSGQK